jgi:hypothetical protein
MREKRRRPEDWEFISFFNLSIEFGVCTKTSFITAPLHELGWQKRDPTIGPAFPLSSSPDDISVQSSNRCELDHTGKTFDRRLGSR